MGILPGVVSGHREAPGQDNDFSSVVFLFNGEGTDEGTDAIDHSNSSHTLTYNDGAALSDAQTLYQDTALYLDGTDDWVSAPDDDDWYFADGAFTIEIRFRAASTSGNQSLVTQYSGPDQRNFWLRLEGTSLTFRGNLGSTTTHVVMSGGPVSADTDHEVAVSVEADGTTRLFLDGALEDSSSTSSDFINSTEPLKIGSGAGDFEGYIYEVRITKGVARYTAAYTPTTETYPTS